MDGITIAPEVDVGTAADLPSPTLALPFSALYTHLIPSTMFVQTVADKLGNDANNAMAKQRCFTVLMRLSPYKSIDGKWLPLE